MRHGNGKLFVDLTREPDEETRAVERGLTGSGRLGHSKQRL